MSCTKIILIFLTIWTYCFSAVAMEGEISQFQTRFANIDKNYKQNPTESKKQLQLLEKDLRSSMAYYKTKEKNLEKEVEITTLFLTWQVVFEMTEAVDLKKCQSEIADLRLEGSVGMPESQMRPDYQSAMQLLSKICKLAP